MKCVFLTLNNFMYHFLFYIENVGFKYHLHNYLFFILLYIIFLKSIYFILKNLIIGYI